MEEKTSVDEKLSPINSIACTCWKKREDTGDGKDTSKSFDATEKEMIGNQNSGPLGDIPRHGKLVDRKVSSKIENKTDAIKSTNSTKHLFRHIFVKRKVQKKSEIIYDSDESRYPSNLFGIGSDEKRNGINVSGRNSAKSKFKLWSKKTDDSINGDNPTVIKKKKGLFSFFKKSKHKDSICDIRNESTDLCLTPTVDIKNSKTLQSDENYIKSWVRKFKSNSPESYPDVYVRWCNHSYLKPSNTALTLDFINNFDNECNNGLMSRSCIAMKHSIYNRPSFSVIENFMYGSVKAFTVQTITDSPLKLPTKCDNKNCEKVVTANESQYSEEQVFKVVEYETMKAKSLDSNTPPVEEEPSEIMNCIDLENASASYSFQKEGERKLVEIKDNVAQCDSVRPKGVDMEIMTDPMINDQKISVKTSFDLSEEAKPEAPAKRNNLTETSHIPGYNWSNSNCSCDSKVSCSPDTDIVFNNMGVKRKTSTKRIESKETVQNACDLQSFEKLINNTLKKMVVTSITSKYSTMIPNINMKRYEMLKKLHVMHFASKFLSFIKNMVDDDSAYDFTPELCLNKVRENKRTNEKTKDSEYCICKQQQYQRFKNKLKHCKQQKPNKRRDIPSFSVLTDIQDNKERGHTIKLGYDEAIKKIMTNRTPKGQNTNSLNDDISTFTSKNTTRNRDFKSNVSTTKKIKEILEDMDIYLMTQSNLNIPTHWLNDSLDTMCDVETTKDIAVGGTKPIKSVYKFKERAVSPCLVAKPKAAKRRSIDDLSNKHKIPSAQTKSSTTRTVGQSYIKTQTSMQFTQKWFKKMWKARTESIQSTTTYLDRQSRKCKAHSQSLIRVYNRYGLPGVIRYFRLKKEENKSHSRRTEESDLSLTNDPTSTNSKQSWSINPDRRLPISSTRSVICIQGNASSEWKVQYVKDTLSNHKLDKNKTAKNDKLSKVTYWTEQCRHNPRFQNSRQYSPTPKEQKKSMRSFGTSVDSEDTIDNNENLKIVYLNSKEIMIVGDILNNFSEKNKKENKICLKVGNKDGKYYVVQREKHVVEEEVGFDKCVGDPKYTNTSEQESGGRSRKGHRQSVEKSDRNNNVKGRSEVDDRNDDVNYKIKDPENYAKDKAKYYKSHTKDDDDAEIDDAGHNKINKVKERTNLNRNDEYYDNISDDRQKHEEKSYDANNNDYEELEINDGKNDDTNNNNYSDNEDIDNTTQVLRSRAKNVNKINNNDKMKERSQDKKYYNNINEEENDLTDDSEEIIHTKERQRDVTSRTSRNDERYNEKENYNINDDVSLVTETEEQQFKSKKTRSNNSNKTKHDQRNKYNDQNNNNNNFVYDENNDTSEQRNDDVITKTNKNDKRYQHDDEYNEKSFENDQYYDNYDKNDIVDNTDQVVLLEDKNKELKRRTNDHKTKDYDKNSYYVVNDGIDNLDNSELLNKRKYRHQETKNDVRQKGKYYKDNNNVMNEIDDLENYEQMIQSVERNQNVKMSKESRQSKYHHDDDDNDKMDIENSEQRTHRKDKNEVIKTKANNFNKSEDYRQKVKHREDKNKNVLNDGGINFKEITSEQMIQINDRNNKAITRPSNKSHQEDRPKAKYYDDYNKNNTVKEVTSDVIDNSEQLQMTERLMNASTKENNLSKNQKIDKYNNKSYVEDIVNTRDKTNDGADYNEENTHMKEKTKDTKERSRNHNSHNKDDKYKQQQCGENNYDKKDNIERKAEIKERKKDSDGHRNPKDSDNQPTDRHRRNTKEMNSENQQIEKHRRITKEINSENQKEEKQRRNTKDINSENQHIIEKSRRNSKDVTSDNQQIEKHRRNSKDVTSDNQQVEKHRRNSKDITSDYQQSDKHRRNTKEIGSENQQIEKHRRNSKDIISDNQQSDKHRRNTKESNSENQQTEKHRRNSKNINSDQTDKHYEQYYKPDDVTHHNGEEYQDEPYYKNNNYDVNKDATYTSEQITPTTERMNDVKKTKKHHQDDKQKKSHDEYYADVMDHMDDYTAKDTEKEKNNVEHKADNNDDYSQCKCKTCDKNKDRKTCENSHNTVDSRQKNKMKEKLNSAQDKSDYIREGDDYKSCDTNKPTKKMNLSTNENNKVEAVTPDAYTYNDDERAKYDYTNYQNYYTNDYGYDDETNNYNIDDVNIYAYNNTDEDMYNAYMGEYADENADNYDYTVNNDFNETANDIYVSTHIKEKNIDYTNAVKNDVAEYDVNNDEYAKYYSSHRSKHANETNEYENSSQVTKENTYKSNHNYNVYKAKYYSTINNDYKDDGAYGITQTKNNFKETPQQLYAADTSKQKKDVKSKTKMVMKDHNSHKKEAKQGSYYYNKHYDDVEYENENSRYGILKKKDSPDREGRDRHKPKSRTKVIVSNVSKSRKKSETIAIYSCHNSNTAKETQSGDCGHKKSDVSIKSNTDIVRFSNRKIKEIITEDKDDTASSEEGDDASASLVHSPTPKLYTNTFFGQNTWNESTKYSSHVLISDQLISNKFGRNQTVKDADVNKPIKTGASKTIYSDIMSINYKNIIDEFYPDEVKHFPPKSRTLRDDNYFSELQDADDENTIHVEYSDISDSSEELDKNKIMLLLKFNLFTDNETNTDIVNSTRDAQTNIEKSNSNFGKTSSIFDLPVKDNTARPIGIVIKDSDELKAVRQDADGKKVLAWAHDQIKELKAEKDKYKRRINLLQNNVEANVALVKQTQPIPSQTSSPHSKTRQNKTLRRKTVSNIQKTCNQTYHAQNYYYNWMNKNKKLSTAQTEYVFISEHTPEWLETKNGEHSVIRKKYENPEDVLQSQEAKEAVLHLYAEKVVIGDKVQYISRLPKLDYRPKE